ncbi:MAG: branched-chain amino acid ABC transporter permease [Pseudomonadota bacterium]
MRDALEQATSGGGKVSRDWGAIAPAVLVFALLALGPLAAEAYGGAYLTSLLMRMMLLAIAAISLDLLIGQGGMVSFGHAAFIGLGAYVAGIMITEGAADLAMILPMAIVASTVFAVVTGAISLRTSGVYFIMITLAFGQMLFFTASSLSAYGGDDGLTLWERSTVFGFDLLSSNVTLYYLILVTLIGAYALVGALVGSRFGRVLRAAKENPTRVEALGFSVFSYRLTAYVIAGVMAGVAGVLMANQAEFVSPSTLAWQRSGELIIMVVLGGMGLRNGALLGAVALVALEETLSSITHDWRLIFGPLLVLTVLYAKTGLAGVADAWVARLWRRA